MLSVQLENGIRCLFYLGNVSYWFEIQNVWRDCLDRMNACLQLYVYCVCFHALYGAMLEQFIWI